MKITWILLGAVVPTVAFTTTSSIKRKIQVSLSDQDDSEPLTSRVQEGTHEELMYALGVNLARQLGDVRPRKLNALILLLSPD